MLAKNSLEGKAEGFLKRIETLLSEADLARDAYKEENKGRNEDIKEIYAEAKEAGVSPKALKSIVKKRQMERKIAFIPSSLNIDDAATYANLAEALGPLGQAAADAAGVGH